MSAGNFENDSLLMVDSTAVCRPAAGAGRLPCHLRAIRALHLLFFSDFWYQDTGYL